MGWLIIGAWLLLSIVIGVLLGKFIKLGNGDGIDIKPSIGGIVDDETDVPPQ